MFIKFSDMLKNLISLENVRKQYCCTYSQPNGIPQQHSICVYEYRVERRLLSFGVRSYREEVSCATHCIPK